MVAKLEIFIDDKLKRDAEQIIAELGLTPQTAIVLFYNQIVEQGKAPFLTELAERNKRTLSIQKLSEELPIRRLDTDEKINEWFNEDE